MKRLLQLSIVLNAILLALVWRQGPRPSSQNNEPRIAVSKKSAKPVARPARSQPQGAARLGMAWEAIESKDLTNFVARLRAAGCPEQTIRDIVVLRVCREYRNRLLALEAEQERALGVMKPRTIREARESRRQQSELRNEMMFTLEAVLGQPWSSLTAGLTSFSMGDDLLASFTPEARKRIRDLEARYSDLKNDLDMRRLTGRLNAEEAASIMHLDRQKQAELAQILTPQELKEYLYRNSEAADYVRRILPPAKSEAEYRAMVDLALQFGMTYMRDPAFARYDATGTGVEEALADRDQRKAAFDAELKRVLGEQRVAEQQAEAATLAESEKNREDQRREEQTKAQLSSMAASAGVSPEDAGRFFDRLKELQPVLDPRFKELEKSLTGTPEEKQKQMQAAIKAEMERIAVEMIGEKGRGLVDRMVRDDH